MLYWKCTMIFQENSSEVLLGIDSEGISFSIQAKSYVKQKAISWWAMVIEQQEHYASKLCKAPSRIATEGYKTTKFQCMCEYRRYQYGRRGSDHQCLFNSAIGDTWMWTKYSSLYNLVFSDTKEIPGERFHVLISDYWELLTCFRVG